MTTTMSIRPYAGPTHGPDAIDPDSAPVDPYSEDPLMVLLATDRAVHARYWGQTPHGTLCDQLGVRPFDLPEGPARGRATDDGPTWHVPRWAVDATISDGQALRHARALLQGDLAALTALTSANAKVIADAQVELDADPDSVDELDRLCRDHGVDEGHTQQGRRGALDLPLCEPVVRYRMWEALAERLGKDERHAAAHAINVPPPSTRYHVTWHGTPFRRPPAQVLRDLT